MAADKKIRFPSVNLPTVAPNASNIGSPGPFKATQLWNQIIAHLRANVEAKKRRIKMRQYDGCFSGSDAVDVILHHLLLDNVNFRKDISRAKAVKLCQLILDSRVFESLNGRSTRGTFEDSSTRYYRFVTYNKETNLLATPVANNSPLSHPGSKLRINRFLEPDLIDGDNVISNPILLDDKGRIIQELMNTQTDSWLSYPEAEGSRLHLVTSTPTMGASRFSDFQRQAKQFQSMRTKPRTPLIERLNLGERLLNSARKRRMNTTIDDCDTPEAVADEVWREVALNRLLGLIELPLLDNILGANLHTTTHSHTHLIFSNTGFASDSFLSQNSQNDSDDDVNPWLSAAIGILERKPDKINVIRSTRSRHKSSEQSSKLRKIALYQEIVDVYCKKKTAPLISDRFMDLHVGIFRLLMQGRHDMAVEAIQLSMLLLPRAIRHELDILVKFLNLAIAENTVQIGDKGCNRSEIQKRFSRVILHNTVLSTDQSAQLVLFIIDHYPEVLRVPNSIKPIVNARLQCLKKGRLCSLEEESDVDLNDSHYDESVSLDLMSYCERVSQNEYDDHKASYTAQAICDLVNAVLDDTKISLKVKKEKLKQLKKSHPEIYERNFSGLV